MMCLYSRSQAELGHDFVDILKIDIEGYEWRALNGMLDEGLLGGPHSAGTSCSKVGSILAELHFHKNEEFLKVYTHKKKMLHNVDVAVGVLGRIRKAGFEVYSRVENWRFGTEMKLKGIVAWNCIEVGLMLPKEFRCQRKSQKEQ